MIIQLIISATASTLLYLYLHKKTRISLRYLYIDNLFTIFIGFTLSCSFKKFIPETFIFISYILNPCFILGVAFGLTMIRFWRTPKRKIVAKENEIVSPADGNIIYITKIEEREVPILIKGHSYSKLEELIKTNLLDQVCWLIGINMTPFDVHKNCAPITGKIILNQHFNGKFLSLKDKNAISENERNTYVIQGIQLKIGVVQIASKLVRRIDSYVETGNVVNQGDWLGMIRFGSQVDIILPVNCMINVNIGEQVYAGSTILAKL